MLTHENFHWLAHDITAGLNYLHKAIKSTFNRMTTENAISFPVRARARAFTQAENGGSVVLSIGATFSY